MEACDEWSEAPDKRPRWCHIEARGWGEGGEDSGTDTKRTRSAWSRASDGAV